MVNFCRCLTSPRKVSGYPVRLQTFSVCFAFRPLRTITPALSRDLGAHWYLIGQSPVTFQLDLGIVSRFEFKHPRFYAKTEQARRCWATFSHLLAPTQDKLVFPFTCIPLSQRSSWFLCQFLDSLLCTCIKPAYSTKFFFSNRPQVPPLRTMT